MLQDAIMGKRKNRISEKKELRSIRHANVPRVFVECDGIRLIRFNSIEAILNEKWLEISQSRARINADHDALNSREGYKHENSHISKYSAHQSVSHKIAFVTTD